MLHSGVNAWLVGATSWKGKVAVVKASFYFPETILVLCAMQGVAVVLSLGLNTVVEPILI